MRDKNTGRIQTDVSTQCNSGVLKSCEVRKNFLPENNTRFRTCEKFKNNFKESKVNMSGLDFSLVLRKINGGIRNEYCEI